MRISTNQLQVQAINAIQDRFNELSKTQNQLSTGRRIIKPSDDPVGSTKILPLREVIARHEQFEKNSDSSEARLTLEDSTLSGVNNLLQRVNELSVQANNDVNSQADRAAIGQELRQILQELMGMANTTDSNGDYLFAGDAVNTTPFTEAPAGTYNYNGDSAQRNVQIGATRQIAIGDPGDDVFMNIPFSGGGTQNIFATINNFITTIEANGSDTNVLQDIQTAIDNVSTIRARIGARINAIDSHRELNQELILQSRTAKSEIEDLDIAEAVGRLNLQLVGLQASQQTFARIQDLSLFNYIG